MRNSSLLIENDTFPFQQGLFINDVHCVLSITHVWKKTKKPFFSGCYEVVVVCMHRWFVCKAHKCAFCEPLGCRKTSACAFKQEQTESGITGSHW